MPATGLGVALTAPPVIAPPKEKSVFVVIFKKVGFVVPELKVAVPEPVKEVRKMDMPEF